VVVEVLVVRTPTVVLVFLLVVLVTLVSAQAAVADF
jgi:hypothetical protein